MSPIVNVLRPKPNADKERFTHDVTGAPPPPMEGSGPFASFRIRNFRILLLANVLANSCQWIQQVALNWLVYDLTGSGTMLGTINMVRSVATLGLVPIAGVLIDRIKHKRLMLAANGWFLAISLGLGLILLFSRAHISYLFAFTFLGGIATSVNMPLRQVVVFDLVPRSLTPNAVALVQTGWALMRSLGPGIGGFLILWFGPEGNFLVQAGAYALITICIMQIHFPPRHLDGVRISPLGNIREGIRYILKERVTRTFMMIGWILPLFIIPIFTTLPPIYAKDVFGGGPEVLGFLLSAVGIGGIVGGIVTVSLSRVERRGIIQVASLFLLSLSLIWFAHSTTLKVALPLLALAGFFEMIFLTTNQTLLQLSIPDNLRGRITGIVNLNGALSPLGGLMAGAGSDLLGGPKMITIVLGSIVAAIAICVLLTSPTIRNYRLSHAIRTNSESTSVG